jgi:hypothetical protein
MEANKMIKFPRPKHKIEIWIDEEGYVRVREEWKEYGRLHYRVAKIKPELLREIIEQR